MKGVGIDIITNSRFRSGKYKRGGALLKKMFTPRELAYCFAKRDPAARLATHFAAKEALWKAMAESKRFTAPLYSFLLEVEVVHDERGKPDIVFLSRRFKKHRALVSIADSDTHAVAIALLQK